MFQTIITNTCNTIYHTIRTLAKEFLNTICYILILPSHLRCKKIIKKENIKSVLLINLQGIGDNIMTTPLTNAVIKQFPKTTIDYCAYKNNAAILQNNKRINTIIKRNENNLFSIDFFRTLKLIRKKEYDLIINCFPAQHSALLTILSNAEYKMGNLYSTAATTNNLAVQKGAKTRDVRKNAANIAEQLGITIKNPAKLSIPLKEKRKRGRKEKRNKKIKKGRKKKEEKKTTKGEKNNKEYIIINPNANWLSKKWPATRWAMLIEWFLKKYKQNIILIGVMKDKPYVDHIISLCKENKRIINSAGQDNIHDLAKRIKDAKLMITTDTGPMQIAIAIGTKTIGLFGVTDPQKLVSGAKHVMAVSAYTQCPKKFQFNHNNEPQDTNRVCIKKIGIDDVKNAVEMMMK